MITISQWYAFIVVLQVINNDAVISGQNLKSEPTHTSGINCGLVGCLVVLPDCEGWLLYFSGQERVERKQSCFWRATLTWLLVIMIIIIMSWNHIRTGGDEEQMRLFLTVVGAPQSIDWEATGNWVGWLPDTMDKWITNCRTNWIQHVVVNSTSSNSPYYFWCAPGIHPGDYQYDFLAEQFIFCSSFYKFH